VALCVLSDAQEVPAGLGVEPARRVDTDDFDDRHFQDEESLCAAARAADEVVASLADGGVDVQLRRRVIPIERADAERFTGSGE
jgi:hypothetical protein